MKVPSITEMDELIDKTYTDPGSNAFVRLMYVTGCRVSELLGVKEKDIPPLMPSQLSIKFNEIDKNKEEFLVISDVNVLKKRKRDKRTITLPWDKNTHRIWKWKEWIETNHPGMPLLITHSRFYNKTKVKVIPLYRQFAWLIMHKMQYDNVKLFNHFMRNLRVCHLDDAGFDIADLAKEFHWTNPVMPIKYLLRDKRARLEKQKNARMLAVAQAEAGETIEVKSGVGRVGVL